MKESLVINIMPADICELASMLKPTPKLANIEGGGTPAWSMAAAGLNLAVKTGAIFVDGVPDVPVASRCLGGPRDSTHI